MTVSTILFNLAVTLSGEQAEDLLSRISGLDGVSRVDRVAPHSKSDIARSMCYLEARPGINLGALVVALEAMHGVESPSAPPDRNLIR
jgi:hypothetical protein